MGKFKFEPKDFAKDEIIDAMEEQCSRLSISELEDLLDLDSDEVGAYSKSHLVEKIYYRYSNEDLFEMFDLWQYFAEKDD